MKLGIYIRTVRHLKPVQIWNRLWRKTFAFAPVRIPPKSAPLPEFTFLNLTATPRGWNDPALPKLWLYNLHYFEQPQSMTLCERWIEENPRGWGNGWEPYPISLRVVNWIKHLGERRVEQLERSMREQVAYLLPRLEYHLLANHLLANAKALVFAGVRLGEERWYRKGIAIYRRELPEQVLDDGVHFELSAMYHSIVLEDLLDLVDYLGRSGRSEAEFFRGYAAKMLVGLRLLTGPDGSIVRFNDAADGVAKSPAALRAYAGRLGITEAKTVGSRGSGYLRLEDGRYCVIAKTGEIGPGYQPGHAHADTWSFELWRDGIRIVADTGTDRYAVDAERLRQRGTAAHNTVMIDGEDSSEVWAGHRVGRRFDFRRHRREFRLDGDGLHGTDFIGGCGHHRIELRWHLPDGVQAEIECDRGRVRYESCMLCVEFGRQVPGRVAIVDFEAELPLVVKWRLK